ncbi:MAG: HEAT repeat domain-containing protein, partial [Chloroflexota bacterium]|nr:HEAT repeat domain-containing protein [Chloroflexota bacterium]
MERAELEALLDRIAEGDEEATEKLLEYISEQPEGIQILAHEALKYGGQDTREQLVFTLADDPDLVVRPPRRSEPLPQDADLSELHPIAQQAGAEWQARVSPQRAPQELLDRLRSGERRERIQAARTLGEYRDPATVQSLMEAIRSGDRQVAMAAVQALQEIGPPAVPTLIDALSDRDEQVRWHAAKALNTIGDERAVPALVQALEDPNYGVRWLAAEELARIGRPAIVPLLRR